MADRTPFFRGERIRCPVFCISRSGAPPTEVGGTNAPASAKPAEAHPPTLIMLAINKAIRPIANIALADTLSAFIRQLKLAASAKAGKGGRSKFTTVLRKTISQKKISTKSGSGLIFMGLLYKSYA